MSNFEPIHTDLSIDDILVLSVKVCKYGGGE